MKKYLKTPRVVCLATFFAMIQALLLGGCGQQTECEKCIDTAMGTVISQTVYVTGNSPAATDGKTDEKVTDVVLQKLNDLEQQELSWRLDSAEVAKINAAAGKGQIQVSTAMAGWLERCLQISEQTGGAFDVSIGKLSRLWDIDTWAAADDPQDYELPGQMVPFDNDMSVATPLMDHLKRSLDYIINHKGPHNLPLIGLAFFIRSSLTTSWKVMPAFSLMYLDKYGLERWKVSTSISSVTST